MINQIILSCNEDEKYSSFWPPVAFAYKKMFPDVEVHLAFLTNRAEDDELVQRFRTFGKVTLFPIVEGIPEFAQSKLIRFILASQQGPDVCYIDDVDLYPLSKDFIVDKTDKRPKDHLLCVGAEVYNHNGCFPISQVTAEGYVWKKFINPNDLDYPELLHSYDRPIMFDRRENMFLELNWDKDDYFSDERLLRRLIHDNPVPKFELKRGYDDFRTATMDRFAWNLDVEKLTNHGYLNAHCCRPFDQEQMTPLIDYIEVNYG